MNTKQIITLASLIAAPIFASSCAFAGECFGRAGVCLEQVAKWSGSSAHYKGTPVAAVQGRAGPSISTRTSKPDAAFANFERLYRPGRA